MWFGPYSHSGPGLCLIWCSSIRKYCDPFWSWNIRIWDACLGDGPLQTCENMSSLLKNVHALYIYIYTHTYFSTFANKVTSRIDWCSYPPVLLQICNTSGGHFTIHSTTPKAPTKNKAKEYLCHKQKIFACISMQHRSI